MPPAAAEWVLELEDAPVVAPPDEDPVEVADAVAAAERVVSAMNMALTPEAFLHAALAVEAPAPVPETKLTRAHCSSSY
jgi:hypothetical protein